MLINYPHSPRTEDCDTYHGVTIQDPYRWLEEIDSIQTRHWIEAQNRLTESILCETKSREKFRKRLGELWNYEKFSVPFRRGGRIFFTRNDGMQNQSVLYWMEDMQDAPRLLLDPNALSEDGTIALTSFEVSDDGKLLAYGLSRSGSDWQDWYFRRVDDGQDLDDHLTWVKFSGAAFSKHAEGFLYSRYAAPEEGQTYKGANYYHKLYYHLLGSSQADDELVYERPDQKEWGFSGQISADGRYLIVFVWKGTHRENGILYKDLDAGGEIVELLLDFDAIYEYAGSDGKIFYFHTDLDAPHGRVIAINLEQPEREHWKEVIAEARDAVQEVHLVGGSCAVVYLHDAHSQVKIFDLQGQFRHELHLPGMGTVLGFNDRLSDPETFYHFTGFTTPGTIYTYNVLENRCSVFREPRLSFNPDDFITEQIFYSSKDGTQVPMFITRRKDLALNGDVPTHLYGYGGFNIPITPAFSVWNLVWMEMGGIYALANLRGGGEYGKPWHLGGSKLQKQNVFDDFIAAAEYLVSSGYTNPARLSISGRSNGGLLTGACLTQRPDLYGAVLVIVGVLDMLRFHKFTIGWGWVSDYGSPENFSDFKVLLAYSPYHNVKAGTKYPPVLVMTGDHDDRVFPAHSYKFAAALQAAQAGDAPILIRIDTKSGHGMGKPTAKLIEESADMAAFLADQLGMKIE
jgi:prolyl oligopeptidase